MRGLPGAMRQLGVKTVTVVRAANSDDESRFEVDAHIQSDAGFFPVDAPIYEGDIVEFADARGGVARKLAHSVKVHDIGPAMMHHTEVEWNDAPSARTAAVRRLGIEALHPAVVSSSSDLFVDGHYPQAIFEALKALEARVREQSGIERSGRDLMSAAFASSDPPVDLSIEHGQSGRNEQEGFKFVFMGVMQGIRNPKGHSLVRQDDPQRALEYLGLVSLLFRRLDDAAAKQENGESEE